MRSGAKGKRDWAPAVLVESRVAIILFAAGVKAVVEGFADHGDAHEGRIGRKKFSRAQRYASRTQAEMHYAGGDSNL